VLDVASTRDAYQDARDTCGADGERELSAEAPQAEMFTIEEALALHRCRGLHQRLHRFQHALGKEVACVVGFYDLPGMLTSYCKGMPLEYCLGAPQGSSPIWLALTLFQIWLRGSAGQWLIAGVGAGVVYGYLEAWWGRSRSVVPAALLALPFFVEPLAWQIYNGYLQGPAIIWLCEALVGAGLLAVMIFVSRRRPLRGAG
jgi:hypothetical protein